MRRSRLLSAGLALTLLAGACTDDTARTSQTGGPDDEVTLRPTDIALTSGLATFDDCDALLAHLRTEGAERVGPYGLEQGGWYGPDVPVFAANGAVDDLAMEDGDSGSGSAPVVANQTDGEAVEGVDFSGTNNQERGVDEPDIVKTDGDRIFTITNGVFSVIDSNDGDPVVRGTLEVGHGATDMLIAGDRVLIFGSSFDYWGGPEPVPMPAIEGDFGADVEAPPADDVDVDAVDSVVAEDEFFPTEPGFHGPRSRIVQIDVSDSENPDQLGELWVDGRHLSARLIDGTARIAIQSNPATLPFVYPSNQSSEERAEEFNRQVVNESTIGDWLPGYEFVVDGDAVAEGDLARCADVHAPVEFAGFGSLSVLSLDLDESLDTLEATSVLAAGETVYASSDTMWLATTRWIDWGILDDAEIAEWQDRFSTQIHGFDITGDNASYLASGDVRGHLLNQFSMSEHDDVLRVATTDGTAWGRTDTSESFITTFEVDGKELRRIGEVGNMGKGERIFAVRFVGDIAYVVTFRQVDPFYTVDLSDPANPVVLGELKINGYSGQLHPIGENRVLGIGQDATAEGRTTGAKVTVFDVTDLANPKALDSWTLPDSWTDAEWSHLSFLWWAPENLAVIPVSSWSQRFWGAVAFHIDPDTGSITEAGRISHEPVDGEKVGSTNCRVVDADDLENYRGGRGDLAGLAEEAVWITQEGGQIQICGEGDSGAASLYCERVDWLDLDEIGVSDATMEICWPQGPEGDPIRRTFVTDGDILWSLSNQRLQANDLDSFESGSFVSLR